MAGKSINDTPETESQAWTRRSFIGAGGTILGATTIGQLLAACGGSSTTAAGGGAVSRTLTIGIPIEPSTVDPRFINNSTDQEMAKNLYSSWLQYKFTPQSDGKVEVDTSVLEGNAMESYSVSEDGKTYTFKLRQGVKYPTTGNPMTADDFIAGSKRAIDLETPAAFPLSVAGFEIKNFTKVSDTEFTVEATKATAVALPSLRDSGLGAVDMTELAKHASASDKDAKTWASRNYAGNGPYKLTTWETGSQLVFDANPDHWGPKPFFEKVVIRIIPSSSDRVLLLQNGTIDVARGLETDQLRQIKDAATVSIVTAPSMLQNMFGLTYDKAPFNNPQFRKAIASAIDFDSLVNDVLGGFATAPKGVWPGGSRWFDQQWDISFDPDQARQLLAVSGGEGIKFTCETSDIDSDGEGLAIAIQTMLKDVGVTMDIKKQPQAVFQDRIFAKKMTAYIVKNGSFVDDPYYHGFLWVNSDAILNYTGYANDEVDALSKKLNLEKDEGARKEMTSQLQQILNAELPYIPIANAQFVLPVKKGVVGVAHEPDDVIGYFHLKRSS